MKRLRGGILGKAIFLIVVLVIIGLILKFGSGWFGGGGSGSGSPDGDKKTEAKQDEAKDDDIEKIEIEVKQDKYFLNGVEVSLDEIKAKIEASAKKVAVTLENNYASAKIWDEIKNALSELNITVVEE